jgi:hypothetical protein
VKRRTRREWKEKEVVDAILDKPDDEIIDEEKETVRKLHQGNGAWTMQFFTPPVVANFIVQMLGVQPGATVLDPACGISPFARFLPETARYTGWEIQRREARISRLLYDGNTTIVDEDAYELWRDHEGVFDCVVGNPPFGLSTTYHDLHGLGLGKGKPKSEATFLEMSVRLAKPGGKVGIIVPGGICSAKGYLYLRDWLLRECFVLAVVDLPPEAFYFSGTKIGTHVLVLQRKPYPTENRGTDYHVFMAICENVGWDSRGRVSGQRCRRCGAQLHEDREPRFDDLDARVDECVECGERWARNDLAIILDAYLEHAAEWSCPVLPPPPPPKTLFDLGEVEGEQSRPRVHAVPAAQQAGVKADQLAFF